MNHTDVEADFKRLAEHYTAYGLEKLEFGSFMLVAILKFLFDNCANRGAVRLLRRNATEHALKWHAVEKSHVELPAEAAATKPVGEDRKPTVLSAGEAV